MSLPTPKSSRMARRPVSKELKLFEALENFTMDNVDPSLSFIEKFVNCDLDLNNTHQSSVLEEEEENSAPASVASQSPVKTKEDIQNDRRNLLANVKGKCVSFCEEPDKISFIAEEDCSSDEDEESHGDSEDHDHSRDDDDGVISFSSGDDDDDDENSSNESVHSLQVHGDERGKNERRDVHDDDGDDLRHDDLSDLIENAVMKKHGTEYLLLTEIKRSLELKEMQLERERENFTELQKAEQKKLKAEIQRVENQRKSLQRLIADYHKLKSSRDENESKMKDLTEKLRETKVEMSKRITRWGEQQRKLEERVKNLEKENQELKKQKTVSQRPALKRPPLGLNAARNSKENLKQSNDVDENKGSIKAPQKTALTTVPLKSKMASDNSINKSSPSSTPDDSGISTGVSETTHAEESEGKEEECGKFREVKLSDVGADQTMPSDYVEIKHPCGTITRIAKGNKVVRHVMVNGDILDEFEDGSVRYYYESLQFSQTTYPNGDEIIEYDSGAVETIRADGSKILTFPGGLVKCIDRLGQEEVCFNDGSIMKKCANGECSITWTNGQKEVRTATYLKRIYPNGTVKIMYNDGSEETRYWNGRIRRKDKNGVLVDDTKPKRKSKAQKSSHVLHSTI